MRYVTPSAPVGLATTCSSLRSCLGEIGTGGDGTAENAEATIVADVEKI